MKTKIETTPIQRAWIAIVAKHALMFATPAPNGVWLYIPHHDRNRGHFDIGRIRCTSLAELYRGMGY